MRIVDADAHLVEGGEFIVELAAAHPEKVRDSDFPDTVAPIRTRTDLSEAAKASILGDTAARFYRLA